MKITIKDNMSMFFPELKAGEVFEFQKYFYIKTDKISPIKDNDVANAVRLDNGMWVHFNNAVVVKRCDAELIIDDRGGEGVMFMADMNDFWIPMKRKKPDIYQKCIISTKEDGIVTVGVFRDDGIDCEIWSSSKNEERGIFCKYYFECEDCGADPWYTMQEVDAWMPYPDRYTYTYTGKKKNKQKDITKMKEVRYGDLKYGDEFMIQAPGKMVQYDLDGHRTKDRRVFRKTNDGALEIIDRHGTKCEEQNYRVYPFSAVPVWIWIKGGEE